MQNFKEPPGSRLGRSFFQDSGLQDTKECAGEVLPRLFAGGAMSVSKQEFIKGVFPL